MGTAISFMADLKGNNSQKNYKHILERGAKLGFRYYHIESDIEFETLDDAVRALVTLNAYDTFAIAGKIDDHFLNIVASVGQSFGILIGDFYDIDTVKYMRLFVNMIRDFAILDIQIFVD